MKSAYEQLLQQAQKAYALKEWTQDNAEGARHNTREGNLWSVANLAAQALHFFLSHLIKLEIEEADETAMTPEAQQALFNMPERPASEADLRRMVYSFLGSQQLEHDDTGRSQFEPEPKPSEDDKAEEDEPVAAVASALHHAGRKLATEVVALWTPEQRVRAFRWANSVVEGGEAPPPPHVSAEYMEDLDLDTDEGLEKLLAMVGLTYEYKVDFGSDRPLVVDWAVAAHKADRDPDGAHDEVNIPHVLVPESEIFQMMIDAVRDGTSVRQQLLRRFETDDFGAELAIQALIFRGDIVQDGVDLRVIGDADIGETDAADLVEIACRIACRDVPDAPDGEKGSAVDEDGGGSASEKVRKLFENPEEPDPPADDSSSGDTPESKDSDDEDNTPKDQGAAAFSNGTGEESCPYDASTDPQEYLDWMEGYQDAAEAAGEEE